MYFIVLVKNTAFHFFQAFAKMGIRAEHFEQDIATAYFNYGMDNIENCLGLDQS